MSVHMHYRIIGLNISECRLELQLTQEQLAERTGICQQFLSRLECGKGVPSLKTIMSLCDAMGVDPNRLLSRSATHDDNPPCSLRSDVDAGSAAHTPTLAADDSHNLIVIRPEDLPILDLEFPDTDLDDL